MNNRLLMACGLALVLAGTAATYAHGMGGGRGCGSGAMPGRRILHALDLRADQKQQVQTIVAQHRTAMAPLIANEKTARQAIADKLMGTAPVTPQDIDTLVQQEAQARTALMRERLALALDVRNVLTPAQIQKAASIHAGMQNLRTQMRQLLGK